MRTKHTPGPWHAVNYAGYNQLHSEPFYGAADLLNQEHYYNAKDNAKLAASAPDLLEALQGLLNADELNASAVFEAQVKAISAIKKATE